MKISEELKDYLLNKKVSLKDLRYLERFSPPVLDLFSELAAKLHPTLNLFKEIAKNFYEIARREEKEPEALLKEFGVLKILKGEGQRREKLVEIRTLLNERRFPTVTQINQAFQKEIEKLSLPSFLKLHWDKTFEREGVKLELSLKDEKELKKVLQELSKPQFKKVLKEIWSKF